MTRLGTIARKDVADAVRSRRYWLLVFVVFALPTLLALLFVGDLESAAPAITDAELAELFVNIMVSWFEAVVPFVAIAVGYRAIAGARESGRLQLLLGLSTTRRDVLLGKLLGRSVVLVASLVVGFVGLAGVVVLRFGTVGLDSLALAAGLVAGYGLVWGWMAVGVSAAVSTRYRALAPLFGLALSFGFLWRPIAVRLLALAFTGDPAIESLAPIPEASEPTWYVYGSRLSPRVAFNGLWYHLDHAYLGGKLAAGGTDPNLFGGGVLAAWALGAVMVGYWRLRRADVVGAPTGGVEDFVVEAVGAAVGAVGGATADAAPATPEGRAVDATRAGPGGPGGSATADADHSEAPVDPAATGTPRRPPFGVPALTVAKKDFANAVRSKLLWSLGAFFFTIVALQNYFNAVSKGRQVQAFRATAETMAIVVPFVALAVGYRAVVGERESGSLKLLLGSPVTRRDVAVGKYLGRAALLWLLLGVGMVAVGGFYLWQFDYLTVERLVSSTAVVLLYGLTWLGIAIGVSSLSRSGSMAVAVIFGAFVFFTALWDQLVGRALALVFTGDSRFQGASVTYDGSPAWFVYSHRLNPIKSYEGLNRYAYHLVTDTLGAYGNPDAVVLPNAFGLAMLVAWATVPVVVGYWRLSRQDIE